MNATPLKIDLQAIIKKDKETAIDYELFNEHLSLLSKGETVEIPRYDFKIRKRVKGQMLTLSDNQIIIAADTALDCLIKLNTTCFD